MKASASDIAYLYEQYVLSNYPPAPFTLCKGKGAKVWDESGRGYFDFTSGIAVTSIGHSHPYWVTRVQEQAAQLVHCSNLFRNPHQGLLAQKLVARAGPGKVFFCNSGAEANETLIKLARLYGVEKTGQESKKYKIICADNAFHGRTFGGMAATPQEKVQGGFRPMLEGFAVAEFNNLQSFAEKIDSTTAAILLEPIQGEGGIRPCSHEFLRGIRKMCKEHGVLLMLDEVQCGVGRTGKFFAFEHAGIRPDAIAMAKGLGGGFPIGAVWVDQKYASLFKPGSHGCTFGGAPLACMAALAVIEVIETERLLDRITEQSPFWYASLNTLMKKHPQQIKEVRGWGYMTAVVMQNDPAPVVTKLRKNGLLTAAAGGKSIRLLPPFTVCEEELEAAVQIFDHTLT